ncbi:HD domain-containing protein [Tabrizicola sp. WMC-M-20]|nr:HD domain-containing protein [Tabrizicola sp. WMC-M-20]
MFKEISDPIHGLVRLGRVESQLLATRAMQRLHGVHQLGLAYMVFPGAKYTRHSHSVGAFHNASQLLKAVARNTKPDVIAKRVPEKHLGICSIIALLHDVGHYPFSHATEHVIKDHFQSLKNSQSLLVQRNGADDVAGIVSKEPLFVDHEKMGAHIINHDPDIARVLKDNGYDPEEVATCFLGDNPEFNLLGVVSSDLDCDRLDYLRRTAHSSGAPYGSVDINFLIEQAALDNDGNFCFRDKAARAADHLLVSRFYDYMQVPFNKTAVAIEWSLLECLKQAFSRNLIDPSVTAMKAMVASGDWYSFDDQHVMAIFREMRKGASQGSTLQDHLIAIQQREPAKLIASWDTLRFRRDRSIFTEPDISDDQKFTYSAHKTLRSALDVKVSHISQALGIDPQRLYVWDATVKFMKDGQDLAAVGPADPAYYAGGVHILDHVSGLGRRLGMRQDMLMGTLKHKYMSGLRLYYLPRAAERKNYEELRDRICALLVDDLPLSTWAAA